MIRRLNILAAALFCTVALISIIARATDPLPSWNDDKAKQSIIAFVTKVTTPGAPDLVVTDWPVDPDDWARWYTRVRSGHAALPSATGSRSTAINAHICRSAGANVPSFVKTPAGEPGLNYLCPGMQASYARIQRDMPAIISRVQKEWVTGP